MDVANKIIDTWLHSGQEDEILSLKNLGLILLPVLPDNVKKLDCSENQLSHLNTFNGGGGLPPNLEVLLCNKNKIEFLPKLPDSLIELDCSKNRLRSLGSGSLPPKLIKLKCSYNQIQTLPPSESLKDLNISHNKISNLPSYNKLERIKCNDNALKTSGKYPKLSREYLIKIEMCKKEGHSVANNDTLPSWALTSEMKVRQEENIKRNKLYIKEKEKEKRIEKKKSILTNIDKKEAEFLKGNCKNSSDLSLEELDTSKGLITLLLQSNDENGKEHITAYCFTYDELKKTFDGQEGDYEWLLDPERPQWVGKPDLNKRVYKEPYTGLWLDRYAYVMAQFYNTLVLEEVGKKRLGTGSSDWVSKMHGTEEDIHTVYTLYPISFLKYYKREKIRNEDKFDFHPTLRDINPVKFKDAEVVKMGFFSKSYTIKSKYTTDYIKVNEKGEREDVYEGKVYISK